MPLFLLLAEDDTSTAAATILAGGQVIDDLVGTIRDVGGAVHALALTAGDHTVVGFVELPDQKAAVALRIMHAGFGRRMELISAVPVGDWPEVTTYLNAIKVGTSFGDEPRMSADASASPTK